MATGADIVNGAVRLIGINPINDPIEGNEMIDAVEFLNDILTLKSAVLDFLAFTRIVNPSDEVAIPDESLLWVKAILAVPLAGTFSMQIPQSLGLITTDAYNTMLAALNGPLDVQYPSTLPMGSGNDCDYDLWYRQNFFPTTDKENF